MTSKEDESRRLPAVMDYKQAAEYLGVSHGRLRNLMWLGCGPKSFSFGKRDRRFRVSDLDAFIGAKVGDVAPATVIKRGPGRPRKGRTCFGAMLAVGLLSIAIAALSLLAKILW
ncbi:helix-turn-helix domain-containing protein [Gluconacetobacter sp. 1b LMG 1731]|uniref:Helix-turn-helix domain-containing protein n=2 Tax=Gluconacetobacter TaxID=89583 RepID=A0A7W4IIS1_9PROT|nr:MULTISPECIES: helix-turn-helix domain-containing protein [Gluconacetobacter]ACI50266.1 conserved hypothetical protein [Gluconacetobacter diazotrophicus PA1 5]MBB2163412.1 helix-turn-helix domain-containing protein [Gluconacetobacter dulcium]MBB2192471.1 helix-turn-helix domain-containing protein [Gluconacetobacter dulcium]TWB08412.1 helix-turn-helix protein [Gluconacetobacter diazotrophicus]CAP56193.1 putative membrane protein [Gluconacetobacter diazotrophicus PA1 5]